VVRRYVRAPQDAEDVVQSVMVRAFESIDGFRAESSFRTWVSRIAVNTALNQVRDAPPPSIDVDLAMASVYLHTSRLLAAEIWRKVHARLDELPHKQRRALELHIFHDLSFKEVAKLSGCSVESAKKNYQHAVKRLRELLPPTP
jgi:RNA polymerase sigma factor (sigma-70 family)